MQIDWVVLCANIQCGAHAVRGSMQLDFELTLQHVCDVSYIKCTLQCLGETSAYLRAQLVLHY